MPKLNLTQLAPEVQEELKKLLKGLPSPPTQSNRSTPDPVVANSNTEEVEPPTKKQKCESSSKMTNPPKEPRKSGSRRNRNRNNSAKDHNSPTKTSEGSDQDETSSQTSTAAPISEVITMPSEGANFETYVHTALRSLCMTMMGDPEKKTKGVVARVETVEMDLYGPQNNPKSGLKQRVIELERNSTKKSSGSSVTSTTEVKSLNEEIAKLKSTNEVLVGAASKLQQTNKSLQKQLHIQQDRSNYLNLHLGGVADEEELSCKQQVVKFFKDILEIPDISEKDFLKANRKTGPSEYTEDVVDGDNVIRLKVKAPGLVFIRLKSEALRELAIQKARQLGGRRHPTLNHKYFVSEINCEAVRASKEKYQPTIRTLISGNKNDGKHDNFHFMGEDFYINGVLQHDGISVPTYAEINYALLHEKNILDSIQLYEMEEPFKERGNEFLTFAVRTNRLDVIRWAYIKIYADHADADHVLMGYRLNKFEGSCDDGEYRGGPKLLRALHKKKLKNAAVFIVRKFTDGQHKLGPRRFKIFTQEAESMIDFVQSTTSRNMDNSIPSASAEIIDRLKPTRHGLTSSQGSTASNGT